MLAASSMRPCPNRFFWVLRSALRVATPAIVDELIATLLSLRRARNGAPTRWSEHTWIQDAGLRSGGGAAAAGPPRAPATRRVVVAAGRARAPPPTSAAARAAAASSPERRRTSRPIRDDHARRAPTPSAPQDLRRRLPITSEPSNALQRRLARRRGEKASPLLALFTS